VRTKKYNRFLLIVIVGIIVVVFLAGFGIAYSVESKLHQVQASPTAPNIGGTMTIYFIDPNGEKIPVKTTQLALVFRASGHEVEKVGGKVAFTVKGYTSSYSYTAKIHVLVEKISQGTGPTVTPRGGGPSPMAIVPLAVTPGGPGTAGSVDEYVIKIQKTGVTTPSTEAPFQFSLGDVIKNPQAGDKYNITIYAEIIVTSNGQQATAISDPISFTVTIGSDNQNTAKLEITNIHVVVNNG